MAISLTIDGKQVALKKGSSIEYVSENHIFTDADDYSMEIELPVGYFSHARQWQTSSPLLSLNRKSAQIAKPHGTVVGEAQFKSVLPAPSGGCMAKRKLDERLLTQFLPFAEREGFAARIPGAPAGALTIITRIVAIALSIVFTAIHH